MSKRSHDHSASTPSKKEGAVPEGSSFRLLLEAQRGDQEAINKLYERYFPLLRRWARGRLPRSARDLVNTEDLIQEAMVKTINKVPDFEYRQEGAFQAYLRECLRNRIRDEVRRVQRRPDFETIKGDPEASQTSPLEDAIGQEALSRYERALNELRPRDRQAVIASVEMGLSHAEIAEILEKPSEDAARMAVSRALVRLAEEMSKAREEGSPNEINPSPD